MDDATLLPALTRIAEALERLAPPPPGALDLSGADAFVWHPEPRPLLAPVPKVAAVPIGLLRGVDRTGRNDFEVGHRPARESA